MKKFRHISKNYKPSFWSDHRGITLVEVIVSIALLGIVVILISDMLMTAFTITYINQPKTKNIYNVGGQVATASISSGSTISNSVTVNASSGNVTVSMSGYSSSSIPGIYQNGATSAGTSSNYTASGWVFSTPIS
jgi:prepilin-type N-terminal cleavage/methylation domain-containing protein